ncbi:MAG: hypothetical protein ABI461_05825 [Polyangiaceae bacterium]
MSRNQISARGRSLSPYLMVVASAVACSVVGLGACGGDDNIALPYFTGEAGVATYEAGADTSTTDGASETSTITDGAITDAPAPEDSAPLGDGSTGNGTLVISQVQSRGTGGGSDELIELYNSGTGPVTFDSSWSLTIRNATGGVAGCAGVGTSPLYTGANQVIASHKHLLLTASAYSESVSGDAPFSAGIPDAASMILVHAGAVVDALCFSYDVATTTTLTTCSTAYTCEGAPATNPHNNAAGSNVDMSLERLPGGDGGNGTDINVNATDFRAVTADPHNLASPAVP